MIHSLHTASPFKQATSSNIVNFTLKATYVSWFFTHNYQHHNEIQVFTVNEESLVFDKEDDLGIQLYVFCEPFKEVRPRTS